MGHVYKRGSKWWIYYRSQDGRIIRQSAGATKGAATAALVDAERGEQQAGGATGRRLLTAYLADYLRQMEGNGVTWRYQKQSEREIRNALTGCGWAVPADIEPETLTAYLLRIRKAGASARTSNSTLRVVKSFVAYVDGKARVKPLKAIRAINVETDRKRRRRALTVAEFGALLAAAERGPVLFGLSGLDRAALYLVAAYTGLRRSELASLTPESFDLERGLVRVQAAYAKNRRADTLPLHPVVVVALKLWLASKREGMPVWSPAELRTADMIRADGAAAGIPFETVEGVADFHALRHTYITWLAQAGTPLATTQKLARHSTPTLTAAVYTHLGLLDGAAAVEKLPGLPETKRRKAG